MKPLWILLNAQAGSGKSTIAPMVASYLRSLDFVVLERSFGYAVKRVAKIAFAWGGDKELYRNADGRIDYSQGRGLLVAVAEKMKELDPYVWVAAIAEGILNDPIIVIDDFRFEDEYHYITKVLKHDAFVIRIQRDSVLEEPSGGELGSPDVSPELHDLTIVNDGAQEDLQDKVTETLRPLFCRVVK